MSEEVCHKFCSLKTLGIAALCSDSIFETLGDLFKEIE